MRARTALSSYARIRFAHVIHDGEGLLVRERYGRYFKTYKLESLVWHFSLCGCWLASLLFKIVISAKCMPRAKVSQKRFLLEFRVTIFGQSFVNRDPGKGCQCFWAFFHQMYHSYYGPRTCIVLHLLEFVHFIGSGQGLNVKIACIDLFRTSEIKLNFLFATSSLRHSIAYEHFWSKMYPMDESVIHGPYLINSNP